MEEAHDGNVVALGTIRDLIRTAERTPKKQRTPEQRYVLLTWRNSPRTAGQSGTISKPPVSTTPAAAAASAAGCPIPLPPSTPPEVFVDASGYGIGLILGDRWLAWKFPSKHPLLPLGPDGKLVMSWAELVAAELGVRTLLAAGYRNVPVTIWSDNEGVVNAIKNKRWTSRFGVDGVLQRVLELSKEHGLVLKVKWISTKLNPADGPSRGLYPEKESMLGTKPDLPLDIRELVLEAGN